ncbi:MAG: hypothetical protein EZS28_047071 [Streblomastix strix]|uniref:Uncharacterized protein n=1 Tax=Streblomastix strix TaxID=222440 RepID=A0A5J4THQ2_9EUKA|nr:MAG: hypothetical protein EZS28_047071 [Streblomastix strix]
MTLILPMEMSKRLLKDLDEHICGAHDPLQGVYRNEAMSDQSLGMNARANELANDIGIHALPQPSLRATAPPKGKGKGKRQYLLKSKP